MARKDFLDEMIAERTKASAEFPELLDAAVRRRRLLEALAAEREAKGLSQTVVAARMHTSQSAVARIEKAEVDVKLSTVERYAAAVGKRVHWELTDA
ncbi:MAG TPA: helix-turn-helix transcriptional regulator [Acidimicrobiales bacterium]|jgi:ribosome-binding protein aMBF1 (putative translation factor)